MEDNKFLYSLRYAVEPGFHEEERLEKMVEFCKAACIDDVMFFINCEELNRGHLTIEETLPWLEVIRKGQELLRPMGITTSINPWTTLLHGDRGRKLGKGQDFDLMVDPYGNSATATACPLSHSWRSYISDMYALYASQKPNIVWVEDDFRLHNHEPLVWGGCFCEAHLEEYSRRIGHRVKREDFLNGILEPYSPHPYRKIWLDTSRDTMRELAELIGNSVRKGSPETRVGLMTSNPYVHCAEGRDWQGVFKGFSGDKPGFNRVHLPSYVETTPQQYLRHFNRDSMLTRAMTPRSTIVMPELESFPDTRFVKSKAFTAFQLHTSSILNSDGITLNIFDMMGNGILEEGYEDFLKDSKEFLSGIKRLGLKTERQMGIKVLVDEKSSYTLHTSKGEAMEELYPQEYFWAELLSSYGISYTYSTDKNHKNNILAVSGQYFRNLSGTELEVLFRDNFIILEGQAAATLFEMGYGQLAGIKNAVWHRQNTGFQAYEQVCDGNMYFGIKEARLSSQCHAGDFLEIEYVEKPLIISEIKNPYGCTVANGMSLYKDKVLLFPYGRFTNDFSCHLNPIRQEILQKTLKDVFGIKCPVFIKNSPHSAVYEYQLDNKKALMIVNASTDDYSQLKIYAPGWRNHNILEIDKNGNLAMAKLEWEDDCMVLKNVLASMELKVMLMESGD